MDKLEIYHRVPTDDELAIRNESMVPQQFEAGVIEAFDFWADYYNESEDKVSPSGCELAETIIRNLAGSLNTIITSDETGPESIIHLEMQRRRFFTFYGFALYMRHVVGSNVELIDAIGARRANFFIEATVDEIGMPLPAQMHMIPDNRAHMLVECGDDDLWFHDGTGNLVVQRKVHADISRRTKKDLARKKIEIPDELETLIPFAALLNELPGQAIDTVDA